MPAQKSKKVHTSVPLVGNTNLFLLIVVFITHTFVIAITRDSVITTETPRSCLMKLYSIFHRL